MVNCVSCGVERGFWGRLTWSQCRNGHDYCASCFGKLPVSSSDDGSQSRACQECGVRFPIVYEPPSYYA